MLKTLVRMIAIFMLIFFIGCKPRKTGKAPADTQENNVKHSSSRQIDGVNTVKEMPQIDPIVILETEANKPVGQTQIKANLEPNKPQLPKTEPNELKTIEPNQVKLVRESNEPNEKAGFCESEFYKKCNDILNNYVSNYGRVDWKNLKRKRAELKAALEELTAFERKIYEGWTKEDKIAFWINIYNLQMLNIIVSNYPIESDAWSRFFYWPPDDIRYIDKKVGGIEKQKFIVMNEQFSFKEIEEQILGRRLNEPSAYFALFHGGRSGPVLLNKAYCGRTLQQQLGSQIKRIISDSQNFIIEPESKTVYLHAMLEPSWYGNYFISAYATDKDFKDQPEPIRAVLNFMIKYLPEKDVNYLKLQNYTVSFVRYNWRLDE